MMMMMMMMMIVFDNVRMTIATIYTLFMSKYTKYDPIDTKQYSTSYYHDHHKSVLDVFVFTVKEPLIEQALCGRESSSFPFP
jgi:hypothetical protein